MNRFELLEMFKNVSLYKEIEDIKKQEIFLSQRKRILKKKLSKTKKENATPNF